MEEEEARGEEEEKSPSKMRRVAESAPLSSRHPIERFDENDEVEEDEEEEENSDD